MIKVLPISVILLFILGSANAQNDTDNGTDGGVSSITTSSPTDPSLPTTTDTTPIQNSTTSTTNGTSGVTTTTTPPTITAPTGTTTDSTVTTTPVTSVPVTTPSTPVSTPNPADTSTISPTSSTITSTSAETGTSTSFATVNSFTCAGNAPSWNLSISKNLITYSTQRDKSLKLRAVTPMSPVGDTSGTAQVYSTKGPDGKPVTILIKKNAAGCTNGLPGQSYQYDATIVLPNMVVMGCCNPL